uniref:Transmembrane protein 214 n=1 Tax=Malurus cyaneus samueli TaxID=2593467 RepID=A0A8C5UE64_9PASS
MAVPSPQRRESRALSPLRAPARRAALTARPRPLASSARPILRKGPPIRVGRSLGSGVRLFPPPLRPVATPTREGAGGDVAARRAGRVCRGAANQRRRCAHSDPAGSGAAASLVVERTGGGGSGPARADAGNGPAVGGGRKGRRDPPEHRGRAPGEANAGRALPLPGECQRPGAPAGCRVRRAGVPRVLRACLYRGRRGVPGGSRGEGDGAAGSRRGALGLPVRSQSPIATSSTIFQLGFERALRKQNKEQVPPAAAPEPPQRKQHTGKSGKKPSVNDTAAKPGKFRSLEEALKALDLADLQKELDKSRSVFPENPSVWVKDLAGYLNYKLQAPRSDPVLSQHPHDYPYCLVSKELRSIIRSLLGKASAVLELFFDHCIYTMLQELDKAPGESLHGYRICIQALLLDRPRIATTNLGKYLEVLRSHQNRPAKCLTVLWALGQAGFSDLHEGLKVWLGVMLPVLGIKSLSPYAVSYLDRLLMMHPNLTKGFGMIGPKDFFPLLDFAFMPNNSLSPSLQEQLQRLYPRLKVLAFGARPEATLHTYFPSFLSRATPACPAAMKKELLTSMSQCLSLDPLSFSVWRQLYTKHLAQSSLLLNHLLESWESSSKKVHQSLQETVCSFKVTNEELAARGTGGDQDVAACDTACKELLHKMKGRLFPWWRLLLILLLCATGFILHDVQTHGSFQGMLAGLAALPRLLQVSSPCCAIPLGSAPSLGATVTSPCASLPSPCSGVTLYPPCHPSLTVPITPCPSFSSGDLTWECVRDHLMSFTYSSWIYLQNTTLALKNWALAMISGH